MKSDRKTTTKTKNRKTGDLGEDIVCKYLGSKGYRVIDRNYLKPWGEIDIIAEKGNILSFVEVKTVSRESLAGISRETLNGTVRPEENFHEAKLRRLHRAIQTYLIDHKIPESKAWQIDLACVYLDFSAKRAHVELMDNITL